MKALQRKFEGLHPCAKLIAKTGLQFAIALLCFNLILMWFAGPVSYSTYFIHQVIDSVYDVVNAVLLIGIIGTIWMQHLYGRK